MEYFWIGCGLRGAYMPDYSYIIMAESKQDLLDAVMTELRDIQEAGYIISKREARQTVNDAWRNLKAPKRSPYSFVVPYGLRNSRGYGVNKCHAIHISHSTEADYLEYQASDQ